MRIILDIDDTICDLVTPWLDKFYKISKQKILRDNITDWDLKQFVLPEHQELIYKIIEDPHIYNQVKPIDGALESYKKLISKGYEVLFATYSTAGCAGRKYEWLLENGFEVNHHNYMEIYRKDLIDADILVDDKFENVRDFQGVGILFNSPWNQKYHWYPRAFNWTDVMSFIEGDITRL